MTSTHPQPSRWYRAGIAIVALLAVATPLHAQTGGIEVSVRHGFGIPSDEYQSNCGHSSLAFSLDVQKRGRFFPQIALDHFYGSGGGDIACMRVSDPANTAVGGLRLEGATRFGLGAGARAGVDLAHIEGVVQAGLVRGRRGYTVTTPSTDDTRHVLPYMGGQGSLVLLRFVVLSGSVHWTRLPLDIVPTSGGPAIRRTSDWSPMTTVQIGLRLGPGRAQKD